MIETTLLVLLPLAFVMGLGYFARRTKRVDQHQMLGINRVLIEFALPAALFTGTVQTPRAALLEHAPLILALVVAFLVFWLIGNAVARVLFHHEPGAAALEATTIAFPNTGFMGVPILGGLFGATSVVTVAIATVLGALMFVPIAVIILEITHHRRAHPAGTRLRELVVPAFANAARSPLVWGPILGAALVLGGVIVPHEILNMLNLMGSVTSGLAMFAAGLTLAAYPLRVNFEIGVNTFLKMIAQPLLMLLLVSAFGVTGELAKAGVILCALPTPVLATILATRYQTYAAEASSTLVLTSLVLLVMLPVWRFVLG